MKALILGKERQLTNIDPSGLFFLTNPKDMSETGIYSGETIENWGDEAYLKRIQAHPQMIFFQEEKSFTVQTAEKTSEDISRLRATNYGMHSIPEIVKSLQAIAESKCINQPAHREACLWNAIEILEDIQDREERPNLKAKNAPQITLQEGDMI